MKKQRFDIFKATNCNVAWGDAGLLLRFDGKAESTNDMRVDIPLPATAGAALLQELKATLEAHEDAHGTSWSAHDQALGAVSDRRTGLGSSGEGLGEHGAQMYRLLKNLPLNGHERSFKMVPGKLLTERLLLGIRRDHLRPEQLQEIVERLGLPNAYLVPFIAGLRRTRFLHFGHEGGTSGTGGSVRKLYQEYEQAEADRNGGDSLLYTGYKWDPASPERRALSRYELRRGLDLSEMTERISALLPGRPDIAATARAILHAAASRCDPDALLHVEVSEEDNPRLSCDINLYAADLTLAELAPVLHEAAGCFGIPAKTLSAHLEHLHDAKLGHISTGTGRDGEPFLTLYYTLAEASED